MTATRPAIEWAVSAASIDFADSLAIMERRADAIAAGEAAELVWLLEHPPCYTAGASAKAADLVDPDRFPVYDAGRGGQFTYHGPGQRVAYVLLDVRRRFGGDVRAFVRALEGWLAATLETFGVAARTRPGRIGLWVERPGGAEEKIAAIGLRVRKGVSFHGVSLNVAPDLSHYEGIVPCGVRDHGVTSLAALGVQTSMREADYALRKNFERRFGPVQMASAPTH